MSDPMDLSLEDIISSKSRGRGGRGRGRRNLRGPGRRSNTDGEDVAFSVTNTLSRSPRTGRGGSNRNADKPYARGNVEGQWKHDLFDGPNAQRGRTVLGTARGGSSESMRIRIENLHWNVTEADIWELMGSLGHPVKNVKIFYDNAGRSEGNAEVTFETLEGAQVAIDTFDERELDGMKMKITLLERTGRGGSGKVSSRLGPKSQGSILSRLGQKLEDRLGPRVGNGAGRGAGAGSRGRGRGRGRQTPASKNVLDDEMDRYMSGEPEPEQVAPPANGGGIHRDLDRPIGGVQREIISYDDVDTPAVMQV
ncbi:hypothetical protein SpCBS45565_g03673 [Spizellomyces sp. 'palustris']|nr:hypothetical protein SpCBS45565_g03673 [Spizellomyces sp. 'palustris']